MTDQNRMAGEATRRKLRDAGVASDISDRPSLTYDEAHEALYAHREALAERALGDPPAEFQGMHCRAIRDEEDSFEVVGVSHYKAALRRAFDAHKHAEGEARAWAVLVPERENPHDGRAVAVYIEGAKVGHLDADTADNVQDLLTSAESKGVRICCPASISVNKTGRVDVMLDTHEEHLESIGREYQPTPQHGDPKMTTLASCPECGHSVSKTAASCPGCGAALRNASSNGIAAVLSFLIPGLGQLYQGRALAGIVLFILFIATIWFLVGIIFWIWAVIDALAYNPKSRAK